jgi:hypothetical protein
MKKLGLAIAAIMGFAILTPVTAEAGGCRTRVTYDNCGYRLTWQYRHTGYNCHGHPVFQWVVVSRCAPRPCAPTYHGGYSGGYSGGSCHTGGFYSQYPRISYGHHGYRSYSGRGGHCGR